VCVILNILTGTQLEVSPLADISIYNTSLLVEIAALLVEARRRGVQRILL